MIDGCNEIHEDASSSDDDSFSLLRDLDACQSNGAPDDMEVGDFDSPVGEKINQVKPPESGASSCTQPAAGCPNSSSQLGNCNIKTINYAAMMKIYTCAISCFKEKLSTCFFCFFAIISFYCYRCFCSIPNCSVLWNLKDFTLLF